MIHGQHARSWNTRGADEFVARSRSSFLGPLRAFLCVFLLAQSAHAGYSNLYIFGDSLSDTGNVLIASGGTIPPLPYFQGRFADGPVWVETLAASLGFASAAAPFLVGGNNYAFGGARTGTSTAPTPGLLAQSAGLYAPGAVFDADALYVLVGGGNDMRDARSNFAGNSQSDVDARAAAAQAAIGNLQANLGFLAANGAKHVLVSNLFDLGKTPEATLNGVVAASTDATNRFNGLIPQLLTTGDALGLNMYLLDLSGLLEAVVQDAIANAGAVYGIGNVVLPCGDFGSGAGPSCAASLFFDALHPTAAAHRLIGQTAFAAVGGAMPVDAPDPLPLLALALIAAVGVLRSPLTNESRRAFLRANG